MLRESGLLDDLQESMQQTPNGVYSLYGDPAYPLSHIFALKKTRASGRNVGKVFNPVVKLVLENQPLSDA